ncbi:transposable element Tc3 transposase [Trichonephila clavipes]|nr:transposable element Tc3 transposase [Trichonephila clavipes]
MGSSPVSLKTPRVGQRCTLNLSRAETYSRWCGVVVRRGGVSSGAPVYLIHGPEVAEHSGVKYIPASGAKPDDPAWGPKPDFAREGDSNLRYATEASTLFLLSWHTWSPTLVNRTSSGIVFLLLRDRIGRPLHLRLENPGISRRRYRTLNCNKTTMYHSIDRNFFYSKDNLVALHFKYDQARRRFVEWAQNEIAVVPDFHKRILFRDEAHFWLNGYVNKQNCRIWSEANPQVHVKTPLHPEKLTVWCALWAGGIIGPYFFKNDKGHNVTVNGDRYRAMITNFFIPELNNHDIQELWFQQDGATCHTARATIDLLKDTFGDRLISRFGPVNWPPRSCDLTPLDYFLWGYVKSLVYADKPQTLDHLEDNIRRVIADTLPQMLEKVIENWTSRLDYIRASRGSPMPEIIFKM